MACPFFMPTEEFSDWPWHARPRLPLGEPWRGLCTAPGHDGETPTDEMLKEFCNFGYARHCPWLPEKRHADKVAFSIARDKEDIILIYYVLEVDHTPGEHGTVQYDNQQKRWLKTNPDPRVQKQAECYLSSYLQRKEVPVRANHPST
ncbi:MAG: hypothetical protein EPN33_03435 [Acidobacteria bacterium]|nr:MAG: hypothetical protein EPN33_03435 [Acidobacteriota bacterium]